MSLGGRGLYYKVKHHSYTEVVSRVTRTRKSKNKVYTVLRGNKANSVKRI